MAALKFNGLLSKIGQSRQLGTTEKIDVFVICETKLNDKVKDQLVDIDEFDLKRHDRSRHGGGFAMYCMLEIRLILNSVMTSLINPCN